MKYLNNVFLITFLLINLDVLNASELTDRNCDCRDTTICLGSENLNLNLHPLCIPTGGTYFDKSTGNSYVLNGYLFVLAQTPGVGVYPVYYAFNGDTCSFNVTIIDKVNATPIQGADIVCVGSSETYYIEPEPTAISYHWWSPELGLNVIDNSNTRAIDFDVASTINLNVEINNLCGTGNPMQLVVTIKQAGQAVIKNASDTLSVIDSVCQNQQMTYVLKIGGTTLSDMEWTATGGTVANVNLNQATIQWGTSVGLQTLEVTYLDNQKGCYGDASRNVYILEGVGPVVPDIYLFGYNLLVCSNDSADSYKWFLSEGTSTSPIPNSNQPYWYADPTRNYFVEICNSDCCNRSSVFSFSGPNSVNESKVKYFSIFPNPARDKIKIQSNYPETSDFQYKIYSQIGKELRTGTGLHGMAELSLQNYPAGCYFIHVWSGNTVRFAEKIIKY